MAREHLREWRVKKRLTQREAADKIGIGVGHYNRIEKGTFRNLKGSTVERLMAATGLPYSKIESYIGE